MSRRAVIFPGQGAQAVGMGKGLAEAFPECMELFRRANEVLGHDLAKICFEGPIEELTKSSRAQPAIFVVSLACYKALLATRPQTQIAAAAGLSSGEWTALNIAGVLSYDDTLRILEARGRFMQEACEERPGGMLSVIGLALDQLQKVAVETGAEIANINSPEQVVLSGPKECIQAAEKMVKDLGARMAIPLNVAGAFHSSLMVSAAIRLEQFLAGIPFAAPSMTVISNVSGGAHGSPEEIKKAMVQQVTGSVQWVSGVHWMKNQGITEYIECGPGKVLTGLIRRIDKPAVLHNIQDRPTLDAVTGRMSDS